jgi:hypothetical protein
MDTKVIAVTHRDMKRHQLLSKALEGRITLVAAAAALGVSYHHAKRLKRRVAQGGLPAQPAIIEPDGLAALPSARHRAAPTQEGDGCVNQK